MKKIIHLLNYYKSYIIITVVCFLLYFIHLPYYIYTPGGAIDLNSRVKTIEDSNINGSYNLLYVSQYEATIPTYLMSLIIPNWDLEKIEKSQISDESMKDIYNRNRIMLNVSLQNALFVAFNYANIDVDVTQKYNYVISVTSNNGFIVGDNIKKIDGIDVDDVNVIRNYVNSKNVNDVVIFDVEREGNNIEIECPIYLDDNGNKIVGIIVFTYYDFDTNPEIQFKFKNNEAGSSGGLMLALDIYDLISDEDLAKGRKIVGTGTISGDGSVGEIDGIKYKIMGAVKNNADIILVPKNNYKEAIKVKEKFDYHIDIVSISSFEDAVSYLRGK